ncbi:VUT family protein [Tumebacillus permanentifrigoris]|uniref:Vitamin uptake transporter n=1 Tax=Tumebacillus permanentifrigoris TaxID=378543 RepID=A0A316D3M3_9BACL|nr:VUT family protein [Tumebacillus permanentifrigoris]PWK03950.1 hypothetical protein C7459_1386 [Tumebacillus permanentifrigoris]
MLIAIYLAAIVAANLSVTYFGVASTIVNAFLFIGLDITTRDKLHEKWRGKGLWWKMAALIAIGSALSFTLNREAGPVALASLIAFGASGAVDTAVYHLLRKMDTQTRVNGSNIVSAAVDSILFPTIAFGSLMPGVVLGQFIAKVVGGYIWFRIIKKTEV